MVVIDFGLARDFKKSSTGVMGTPGYMPPEAGVLQRLRDERMLMFLDRNWIRSDRCGRKAFGPFMEISFPWAPWLSRWKLPWFLGDEFKPQIAEVQCLHLRLEGMWLLSYGKKANFFG